MPRIERAFGAGRHAAFLGFEDGVSLGCRPCQKVDFSTVLLHSQIDIPIADAK